MTFVDVTVIMPAPPEGGTGSYCILPLLFMLLVRAGSSQISRGTARASSGPWSPPSSAPGLASAGTRGEGASAAAASVQQHQGFRFGPVRWLYQTFPLHPVH